MRSLLTFFLSLVLMVSVSEARSKKKNQIGKHKVAKRTNKKIYSFTYDKIWFASLTSKQQIIYLKTVAKLGQQISKVTGKHAFNQSIINSFFPPAFGP